MVSKSEMVLFLGELKLSLCDCLSVSGVCACSCTDRRALIYMCTQCGGKKKKNKFKCDVKCEKYST